MFYSLLLGALSSILGTALLTVRNTLCIQSSANDVITATGEVTYTSASDEDNGVLLQVMSDTGNISGSFHSVRKSYSGDLTQSRVRLLRAGSSYLGANASLLRCAYISRFVLYRVETSLKNRGLGLILRLRSAILNKLVKGWHISPPSLKIIKFIYSVT